ncbi:MAG: oligopeptidase B, partial [Deltaproteobacteria bacterium]|nr:oligopeptidase B [Deltaproteobacteria bacterium]
MRSLRALFVSLLLVACAAPAPKPNDPAPPAEAKPAPAQIAPAEAAKPALTPASALAPAAPPAPVPPVARKEPKDVTVHGDPRTDEYAWLRQKGTPEVEAYLHAENAYADALTASQAPLRETLYQELVSRLQETDADVPYRRGAYFYYSRTE